MILSPKERDVLRWIVTLTAAKGYAPSRTELEAAAHLSRGGVTYYLAQLVAHAAIRIDFAVARGLVVVHPEWADDSAIATERMDCGSGA